MIKLTNGNNIKDLLNYCEKFETEFIHNPRYIGNMHQDPSQGITSKDHGAQTGDIDLCLWGPDYEWEPVKPSTISETEWDDIAKVKQTVFDSVHDPYHYVTTIYHLFVEEIAPQLVYYQALDGNYDTQFNAPIVSDMQNIDTFNDDRRIDCFPFETLFENSQSYRYFTRDPSLILNRIRFLRNKITHRHADIFSNGGPRMWGGIFVRYFEAFLEETKLVRFTPTDRLSIPGSNF